MPQKLNLFAAACIQKKNSRQILFLLAYIFYDFIVGIILWEIIGKRSHSLYVNCVTRQPNHGGEISSQFVFVALFSSLLNGKIPLNSPSKTNASLSIQFTLRHDKFRRHEEKI